MASFAQRGNKILARVNIKGYPPQGKVFASKAEAEDWATTIETAMKEGTFSEAPVAADVISVADLIDRHVAKYLTAPVQKNKIAKWRYGLIKRYLGHYNNKTLTKTVIAEFRDKRLLTCKASSVVRDMDALHGILKKAKRDWGLKINEDVFEVMKPIFYNKRDRRLTPAELDALYRSLDECRNPYMVPITKFALATAMRRGEIISLRWDRIDFERRTAYLPITKNGRPRLVPLSSAAIEILNGMARDDERVFPITEHVIDSTWRRAVRRAGIEDFHYHDLRHMSLSAMSKKIPNVIELSRISGHVNISMLDRYYHTTPEELALKLG
ncbi:site-specific integrase [Caballeronia zhejiangensis]|uniref:site-specific integrase n=1 Tax=Caballeronia zhejiangensis TaxID=871203 RepID=UPI001F51FE18|nr:site-specific integrase [Caballeronia zhejiangensis]MCI1046960.1 site-specific integrase [Caballeronia zhejiangensis]